MEVQRDGHIISIMNLDASTKDGLKICLNTFIKTEIADVQVNIWEVQNGYVIDIYCESDVVVRRLEEYLNSEGYILRLTPKKVIV